MQISKIDKHPQNSVACEFLCSLHILFILPEHIVYFTRIDCPFYHSYLDCSFYTYVANYAKHRYVKSPTKTYLPLFLVNLCYM
jgi:hypothetical protein